jgi:hypothetical protein
MNTNTVMQKKTVPLILLILVCFSATIPLQQVKADNTSTGGWNLFITTSKPVNNNTAMIQKSGFMPGELIHLQANVTYNGQPRANLEVTFRVERPSAANSTTIYRSAVTSTNGAASIDFRIPKESAENQVLGNWSAYCTVATIDNPLIGNYTFYVRWPTLTHEIKMLDETGSTQTSFNPGQIAKIVVTTQNNENQSFDGYDIANISDISNQIGQVTFDNISITNGSNTFENSFTIPANAVLGEAKIESTLFLRINQNESFTADSKSFTFIITDKATKAVKDIAVTAANVSPISLYSGEKADITFTVANLGNETENINVEISHQKGLITNFTLIVEAFSNKTAVYNWDTTNVIVGNYTITVNAQPISGEENTANNHCIAGTISVDYQPVYQTVELFSVLLVVTGLFVFSLLFLFVKKQRTVNRQNFGTIPKPI